MSINLSLDHIKIAVEHLPKYTRPTCHIAGTNGKGSVTAIISSIFRSSSPPLIVGRFNSPHLVTIYDCILINDEPIDHETYASIRDEVERVDRQLGMKLSNFEILTLTALQTFERIAVDVAIVEVGMGGRLDATNIIPDDAILVSALTSVDFDHQAFLGNTVSVITKEKAGIARPGRPFVLGPQWHPEVSTVVRSVLSDKRSDLVPLLEVHRPGGPDPSTISFVRTSFEPPVGYHVSFSIPSIGKDIITEFPLLGDHQIQNLVTALTTLSALLMNETPFKSTLCGRLSPLTVARGIKRTRWRGRLSFHQIFVPRPIPVLVDGAHNPASAKALANYVAHIVSLATDSAIDLTYIIALSHSPPKEPLEILLPLLRPKFLDNVFDRVKLRVALVDFSPPAGMPWVKPVPPSDLVGVVKTLAPNVNLWVGENEAGAALPKALEWASEQTGDAGLVVIAGSLYLVADFYRAFAT